VLELLEVSSSC